MTVFVDGSEEFPDEAVVVKRAAAALLSRVWGNGFEIGFRLMGQAEMTVLNRVWRHKAKPTDVLSFGSDDPAYVGDVALCVPVAREQARRLGHPLSVELTVLTVHALAHLAGLDHEASAEEARLQCEVEMGWLAMLRTPPEAALARRGM
jgi:probable rRNA maturation factor